MPIQIRTIVDIVVYGGMAHTKPAKTAVFEAWVNSGIMGFIWAEFFAHARVMLNYLRYFRQLNSGLLDGIKDRYLRLIEVHE